MTKTPLPAPDAGPSAPYETAAPNSYRWTKAAFDLLVAGKLHANITTKGGVSQASAGGECPRCGHHFSYAQPLQAILGETVRTLGAETLADSGYIALTVPCRCSEAHTGRPDEISQGCGINFRVEVHSGEVIQ